MKTKIGIISLVLVSLVIGGIAFNAYQVEAGRGLFHKINKNSEEWQAQKGEWKEMSAEERKAKMEALKGEKGLLGFMHPRGLMKKFADDVIREVVNIDDGIQITITSDNEDIVQKLQAFAEKFNSN
jgi:hypothetical protein